MDIFAKRLKELREERGLSQRQLAKAAGLSQGGITNWERGIREPNGSVIIKLAQYFGVSTDFLLGLTDY